MQKYYDDWGKVWAMLDTPDGSMGLILGPPDLSSLHLNPAKEKKLRERLVEEGLYSAPLLINKRPLLLQILQEVGLPRETIRPLVSAFQLDYDGDGDNG
jgi:hypothetical protein